MNGNAPTVADSWRRLALAILLRAARDAQSGNGTSAEARHWLCGDPLAGFLLDSLDIAPELAAAWVARLETLAQPSLFEL